MKMESKRINSRLGREKVVNAGSSVIAVVDTRYGGWSGQTKSLI